MQELAVIVVYVPTTDADAVREALDAAGAGQLGDYRGCSWSVTGTGRFTPLAGAHPVIGRVDHPEEVTEDRIEVIVPVRLARAALSAALAVHPYEEPAYHVYRVATLEQMADWPE